MDKIRPRLASPEATRHVLKAFGLRTNKRLGQNFLVDAQVLGRIVDSAELSPECRVLEIGAGIGTLTGALAETGAAVTAVELDKRLLAVLAETLAGLPNVRLIEGDILKLDLFTLMGGKPFSVVANLPYYITTPIIMALLEKKLPIKRLLAMVQKEVAQRMIASPGSKSYGALSVAVQYYTAPEIVLEVPPGSFLPPPEVSSAVIACEVREWPPVEVPDEGLFFRIVRGAFGQRRKTIVNALKGAGFSSEVMKDALLLAGIDFNRRGETLSLGEFAALCRAFIECRKE